MEGLLSPALTIEQCGCGIWIMASASTYSKRIRR